MAVVRKQPPHFLLGLIVKKYREKKELFRKIFSVKILQDEKIDTRNEKSSAVINNIFEILKQEISKIKYLQERRIGFGYDGTTYVRFIFDIPRFLTSFYCHIENPKVDECSFFDNALTLQYNNHCTFTEELLHVRYFLQTASDICHEVISVTIADDIIKSIDDYILER